MLTFATAVFFLLITPGPGVLSTAGVGSGYGAGPGLRFLVGLFIGSNLVMLAVVSGLAGLIFSIPYTREALMTVSALYLLYLAYKIAFSGSRIAFIEAPRPPGIKGGLLLQALNPKTYAVITAIFSGFAFWPENLAAETAIKIAILNGIWIPIHLLWLAAGIHLKKLAIGHRTQTMINIIMALAMVAVVALAFLV